MSPPARVLVSGYYGFGNAGDEAILAGLVRGFRELAPEAELTVLSGDPEATESEHGVRGEARGLASVYRLARRSDLFISGGGGLLQDITSRASPLYYLAAIRLARAAGIPVACVGQGIGPLQSRATRMMARQTLSRVDALAVRDRASQRVLRDMGVDRSIEVTADLAFLLPKPTREESELACRKAGLPPEWRPAAFVALRPPRMAASEGDAAARMGQAIGGACDRAGLRPVVVPMQSMQDAAFAERVAGQMHCEAKVVSQPMSACGLLALAATCDLVVAMRLHALIFAAISGVPPVAVSYDPKVDALMEQLGLESATSVERFDEAALARAVGETRAARGDISADLERRAQGLREASGRNIALALELLRDRA